jgi:hypothetical protein
MPSGPSTRYRSLRLIRRTEALVGGQASGSLPAHRIDLAGGREGGAVEGLRAYSATLPLYPWAPLIESG